MSILLGVVLLFAALSAVLAGVQATAISRLAPEGQWRGWLFGWWRFAEIEQRAGLAGEAQAAIYKRAVIAAVGFVILGLILSGWTVNQQPHGAAEATPRKFNGWRIDYAAYIPNSLLRPEVLMPSAYSVES